eukprot:TRINITY_DN2611_c0_g1_i5.p1 TRINITY_DN2611_c0_g1~~TRINITY_DN2611_c0_g1_i5.p1  ORF type:complete len:1002 (+),score=365.93 TRINITY_DN2611_c0_g1_i5:75-3080(+)
MLHSVWNNLTRKMRVGILLLVSCLCLLNSVRAQVPAYTVVPRTCTDIVLTTNTSTSGTFTVYPKGYATTVYCDNSLDFGGWQLVFAYDHVANTNPNLNTPVIPTSPTGFSHISASAIGYRSALVSQVRFQCLSAGANRLVRFKSIHPNVLTLVLNDYSPSLAVSDWTDSSRYALMAGHQGYLPMATNGIVNQNMYDFPFYASGNYHWGVRGLGSRWECDDYVNSAYNTNHQIYFRSFVDVPVGVTVVTLASSTPLYDVGQPLDVVVNFNSPVTVSGSFTLQLTNAGFTGGSATANYLAGSSTSRLTFRYIVRTSDVVYGPITYGVDGLQPVSSATIRPVTSGSVTVNLALPIATQLVNYAPVNNSQNVIIGRRAFYPRSCSDIVSTSASALASGTFTVYPSGLSSSAVTVYCDFSDYPRGDTLFLAYQRAAGTNPALTTALPTSLSALSHLAALSSLGYNLMEVSSLRFYCTSGQHSRVMNFRNNDITLLQAAWSGSFSNLQVGSFSSSSVSTLLSGHSASLPYSATTTNANSLTEFPFYSGSGTWAVKGSTTRWECDSIVGGTGYDYASDHRAFFTITVQPPYILSVSSPQSGTFPSGSSVKIVLNFTVPVQVTGQPLLYLTNLTQPAVYSSGSLTSLLTFTYNVEFSNSSSTLLRSDLAATALSLPAGTFIRNPSTGIDAVTSLPWGNATTPGSWLASTNILFLVGPPSQPDSTSTVRCDPLVANTSSLCLFNARYANTPVSISAALISISSSQGSARLLTPGNVNTSSIRFVLTVPPACGRTTLTVLFNKTSLFSTPPLLTVAPTLAVPGLNVPLASVINRPVSVAILPRKLGTTVLTSLSSLGLSVTRANGSLVPVVVTPTTPATLFTVNFTVTNTEAFAISTGSATRYVYVYDQPDSTSSVVCPTTAVANTLISCTLTARKASVPIQTISSAFNFLPSPLPFSIALSPAFGSVFTVTLNLGSRTGIVSFNDSTLVGVGASVNVFGLPDATSFTHTC